MPFLLETHTFKPGQIQWEDVWPRDRQTREYTALGTSHGTPPKLVGPVPYRQSGGQLAPGGVLPDIVPGRWTSDLMVSDRVRRLIADGDRVSHHFVPLDLTLRDGAEVTGQYFLFVAGDLTDGVVAGASNVTPKYFGDVFGYYTWPGVPEITWRADAIEGRRIWVDRYLPRQIFISDSLEADFRRLTLTEYDTKPSFILID